MPVLCAGRLHLVANYGGSTMHNTNKHESICRQLISVTVFLVLLTTGLWISEGLVVWAGDEKGVYSDKAGREAFRLWTEKERDRAIAEAARRYWDYWLSHPSRRYSGYRLWLELESTQRWLKDPEHNPPPPPLSPWMPSPYPPYPYSYYKYYYPSPYHWAPPSWPPPPYYPYYPYPGAGGWKPECEGK